MKKLLRVAGAFFASSLLWPVTGFAAIRLLVSVALLLSLASCATLQQSILFGATMGAASGTGVGVLVEKSPGSALIGAGIGTVLAGGVAYLLHSNKASSVGVESKNGPARSGGAEPSISAPEAHRIWVEDKYDEDGKVLEEGHYKYIIERPSTWTR